MSEPQINNDSDQKEHNLKLEQLLGDCLSFREVAEKLDVPVTKVHKLVKEHALLAATVGEDQSRVIPAKFLREAEILESLKGTITVLDDAGFTEDEILRWLFTEDPSLDGSPIDSLRAGRKTEIRRRAQTMG